MSQPAHSAQPGSLPGPFTCTYASVCSGCDDLSATEADQRRSKEAHLRDKWNALIPALGFAPLTDQVEWHSIDRGGLRDRVDLMIDQRSGTPRLGLFDRSRSGITDLEGCPQLSPELEAWLRDFRRTRIPVARGSVRLRVSPAGQRGVWLDLANVDVKDLLDEDALLSSLLDQAVVEIGQRRKRLIRRDGRLKLSDPVLETWFETYVRDNGDDDASQLRAIPLFATIGTFTQPGFRANRKLVGTALDLMPKLEGVRAIEFGSGIGNFTLPLASVCENVAAYEVDRLALDGLERSLEHAALTDRVTIHAGNFQGDRSNGVRFGEADIVFVDPPRSGLMKFLDPLEAVPRQERPRHFMYVSCFTDSFVQDAARLLAMGYALRRIAIVDQFPQSRHYELVAAFERD